jgi:molybdate ABC transporter, permease protein
MDYTLLNTPLAKKAPEPDSIWQTGRRHLAKNNSVFAFLSLPMLLFFLLPILAIFIKTPFSSILENLSQQDAVKAISLSLLTSLITALITIVFGTPVAFYLAKNRSRFSRVIDTLVDLPTVLPPAVAGVALLMAFGRNGLFASWLAAYGISIPFTTIAVIMAQTFIAAPLYIKAACISFAGINNELQQAAALDGANRWQVFRYIVMPLSWMGMLSGSVMTWARALGEFGATIIFAGNFPGRTQTMPLAIYIGFEIQLNVALTLSVILIAFSFLTLILVKNLLYHRMQYDQ